MTKLIIQIPCFNEESTLGETLDALPREVAGFDIVEWLVIDDGSTDDTLGVARLHLVDHVVRLPNNQGLARAFSAGLEASLRRGADVIVNTDADNQYNASDIPRLVAPILHGRADMVVGARPIWDIDHFSPTKKLLQKVGSWFVRLASGTEISDAPSGFRAFSREAAKQLNVFNEYTYTLETLIQAGQKGMGVVSVPIRVNGQTRPSRLIRSLPGYVANSAMTIVRSFVTYRPFPFFAIPGVCSFLAGLALGIRFLIFYLSGAGQGHVQSLILAALLMGTGFFLGVTGLVVDLISVNRKLLERLNGRVRDLESRSTQPVSDEDDLSRRSALLPIE